ncbi:MAG: GNAT family N-acetyltransferase [Flavobacteriaceae bacterium]
MEIQWKIKRFEDLSVFELYGLLRLREQVFIIEQNCIYPDLDNKDPKAIHIIGCKNDEVIAYSRIFHPSDYFETASIGRVVVAQHFRKTKLGFRLMQKSIEEVRSRFKEEVITISAQYYLIEFYKSLGFIPVGETYLEDDIPHIRMVKN